MCEHCSSVAYLKPGCRFSVKKSVKQVRPRLTSEESFPFSPQSIHLPGRQRAGASKHPSPVNGFDFVLTAVCQTENLHLRGVRCAEESASSPDQHPASQPPDLHCQGASAGLSSHFWATCTTLLSLG